MRPQWRPKREVPEPRRWTSAEHLSVMFPDCPRCSGRVVWGGDGDTRWLGITGIRGVCLLCAQEWYTRDLLAEREVLAAL